MDIEMLKIVEHELQRSDIGHQLKIFNRAIEPNEDSCGVYKAAIEKLPNSLEQLTEFDICQQKFEEYKESEKSNEGSVKFDMVHFIHSIYYVDIEQAVVHCLENEIGDHGVFVACIVDGKDLVNCVISKQSPGEDSNN